MEIQHPVSPAATCPRWVILDRHGYPRDSAASNTKTSADARTSTGRPFRVSFDLTSPPAISKLYYDWAGRAPCHREFVHIHDPHVIAAHGGCLLIDLRLPRRWHDDDTAATPDYFVYDAGAARPPSLSLLPSCHLPTQWQHWLRRRDPTPHSRLLYMEDTGILRRGEDGMLLVVQLHLSVCDTVWSEAELCVLRGSLCEWEQKRVTIVHSDDGRRCKSEELRWWWKPDAAVPVGDRFVCWVDYSGGVLFCDMATVASPELRYVPLPMVPPEGWSPRPYVEDEERFRSMCAAGSHAARFVEVEPRGCCDSIPGECTCPHGHFAFILTTWTLRLTTDEPSEMATMWVKDGVLDSDELWALPGYEGLPSVTPEYPIVSSDDPEVVCFMVRNDYLRYDICRADRKAWMVEVDTRSKVLRSVLPYTSDRAPNYVVPTKLH